jgi:hypothetical protein
MDDQPVKTLPISAPLGVPATERSAEEIMDIALSFLRDATPREPYIGNCITRLSWWRDRGFEGRP